MGAEAAGRLAAHQASHFVFHSIEPMLLVSCIRLASKWWTTEALQFTTEFESLANEMPCLRRARIAFSVRHNVPP